MGSLRPSAEILAIHAYLDRLGGRLRRLLVGRAVLQGLTAAGLVLTAAGIMFSLGASRASVAAWAGGLGSLTVAAALAWPLAWRWRSASSMQDQARTVERIVPDLRSRLLTAVDRAVPTGSDERSTGPWSAVLLARATRRAWEVVKNITPQQVYTTRDVWRACMAALAALAVTAIAALVLPVGPWDALRVLFGESAAAVRMETAQTEPAADRALVGDIVFRYVFPDYTGLDPLEVPNSDGTIHAPPGTIVHISARTGEAFDAAAIQVDDNAPVDATLAEGRDLAASVEVEQDGVWRFLLFRVDEVVQSPDYKIVVEYDAPPVVAVSSTGRAGVPVDRALGLRWQANDDYGIKRVVLEVEHDGQVREVPLREPIDTTLEMSGRVTFSPRELGLGPGDEATLRVVAYDNDGLQDGNRGVSEALVVDVLGPRGRGRRLVQYHKRLRDVLVVVLADFIEEPMPPSHSSRGMLRWVHSARTRFDPVREIYEAQWGEETPDGVDGTLVQRVLQSAARLSRFTVTTFETRGQTGAVAGRRPVEQDFDTFAELHSETVQSVEQAVWVIDAMLRQLAVAEVAKRAWQVSQEAAELSQLVQEGAEASEMLARLDQLERLMRTLAQAAAQLSEGQLQEFVNGRLEEAQGMIDAIRQALAEDRVDDAREMIQRLSEMLEQMAEGLDEQMSKQSEGDDELRQRYDQLIENLAELEANQESLADELAQARDQDGDTIDALMVAWRRLDALAADAVRQSETAVTASGDARGWRSSTVDRLERLRTGAVGLQSAIRARNPRGGLERVIDAERDQDIAQRRVESERTRMRSRTEPVPEGVETAVAAVRDVESTLREMREILEEMVDNPVRSSPELQERARRLSSRQQQLGERQEELEQEVQTVERAMPTADGSAVESMRQAGEAMERAENALEGGSAMAGEGHQRDASGRLRDARQNLEREMGEYQQMQRSMQQMRGEKDGDDSGSKDDGEGEGEPLSGNEIEIPAPESFQTPEEYRRALLEGMSGDVPEEYEALKKRFYEELVRQ